MADQGAVDRDQSQALDLAYGEQETIERVAGCGLRLDGGSDLLAPDRYDGNAYSPETPVEPDNGRPGSSFPRRVLMAISQRVATLTKLRVPGSARRAAIFE